MTKSPKTTKIATGRAKNSKARLAKPAAKAGTKMASLIDLLSRPSGASLADIGTATGWQSHSIRGAISGHLKKKLRLNVSSVKSTEGVRLYKVVA